MTEDTASKILKKLKEQGEEGGSLPPLLKFYQELLRLQSSTYKRLGTPEFGLSREVIRQRLRQGLPLVGFDYFSYDWYLVQDSFNRVSACFASYPELFGDAIRKLQESAGCLLTKETFKAWYSGEELPHTGLGGAIERLVPTIIQATLQPFLASYAEALIGSVEQELWYRGFCPICGGKPDMAFLDKERGARWLLCSRCDAEWLFRRLECPYCGTQEQNALSFFADDKDMYRLYVCERCKCYLKAIDLRKTEAEVLLPLERLNTLDLDKQAQDMGYHPCGSGTYP
jgi:FdhE protein